jgi:hypothetical protein
MHSGSWNIKHNGYPSHTACWCILGHLQKNMWEPKGHDHQPAAMDLQMHSAPAATSPFCRTFRGPILPKLFPQISRQTFQQGSPPSPKQEAPQALQGVMPLQKGELLSPFLALGDLPDPVSIQRDQAMQADQNGLSTR